MGGGEGGDGGVMKGGGKGGPREEVGKTMDLYRLLIIRYGFYSN